MQCSILYLAGAHTQCMLYSIIIAVYEHIYVCGLKLQSQLLVEIKEMTDVLCAADL